VGACVPTEVADQTGSSTISSLEEEGMEQFFGGRTALLLSSRQIDVKSSQTSVTEQSSDSLTVNVEVNFKNLKNFDYGTAAVIDPRGYFITAAHCLDDKEIYAFYPDSKNRFSPHKTRVVWKGNPSRNGFDFTIFHAPSPPGRIFHWADSFKEGAKVHSAANTYIEQKKGTSNSMFDLESFTGMLTGSESRNDKGTGYQRIFHQSPIMKGSSGGPVVDERGRLIGINCSQNSQAQSTSQIINAIRPDLNWLKGIIEKDHASLSQ